MGYHFKEAARRKGYERTEKRVKKLVGNKYFDSSYISRTVPRDIDYESSFFRRLWKCVAFIAAPVCFPLALSG
jgi:hypothetical protein